MGVILLLGNAILNYETGELKEELEDKIGQSNNSSILVIHEIMLYPKYRNKGYGKEILKGIEIFFNGKCSYIVLKSFPKQHDLSIKETKKFNEFGFEKLNNNFESSQVNLDFFVSFFIKKKRLENNKMYLVIYEYYY